MAEAYGEMMKNPEASSPGRPWLLSWHFPIRQRSKAARLSMSRAFRTTPRRAAGPAPQRRVRFAKLEIDPRQKLVMR
jgi:hypothetical protein